LIVLGAVGVSITVESGGAGDGITGGFVSGGGGGVTVVVGGVVGTTAPVGLTDS
jgi:hypothetical protein